MAEIVAVRNMADAEALRTLEYAPYRIRLPQTSRTSKRDSEFHRTIEFAPHRVRIYSVDHLRAGAAVLEIVEEMLAEGRGWSFGDLAPLRLAVRLFQRLRIVRYSILRALLRNPGDLDEHRRLRTHGDAIRHIGRDPSAPSVVRVLAVKLGNRLKKVAAKMISGKRSAAWFQKRIASLTAHIKKVLTKRIPLM